ncbi:hypothetical protein [Natronoarchaeum rubrum]|uniref:hypothetical protein n=1 Tax=Natronoarchaeum rubrum TaxID=755311 RepID=UPI00211296EC|nr:hypothetical protein [Natronoarchaeum rubrum]
MARGSFSLRRLTEYLDEGREAFGRPLSLGTTNEADLAGHYPYNPERFRVFVNGERQLLQYGSVAEYEDVVDGHRLKPQSAGDVVTMETAEMYRYVVQYVVEWSAALQLSQQLQAGEALIFGYGDADLANSADDFPGPAADGWFWHWHSGLDANEVRLAEYRNGTTVDETVVELEKDVTVWKRLAGETNWYNVGNTRFVETYTGTYDDVESSQRNDTVARTSVDDGKGPQTANKQVQLSIKAEAGAGSLEAELGSVGVRTLGDVGAITREKTYSFTASVSATGTWVPIAALRIDPDRDIVNVQVKNTDVTEFGGDGDVTVMPMAVDPQNALTDGGSQPTDWSAPVELNPTNSVVETSASVDQIPDATGTVSTSAADPGGYQLGFGSRYSSGTGSKTTVSSGSATRKREISSRDVCVFLANASVAGDVTVEVITEQDW